MVIATGIPYASERSDNLCRAAYDTVCDVFKLEIDGEIGVPAMVGTVHTLVI